MKILIVTGIFPPDIGGPATYVPMVAKALSSRGHSVSVLTLSDQLRHDDSAYSFDVIRIPRKNGKLARRIETMARIVGLGRAVNVLLVCGLSLEAVLANVFIRKPLVMRIVGDLAWERATNLGQCHQDFDAFQNTRQSLRTRTVQRLQRWWVSQADVVIVPSRYLARWVISNGVKGEKIILISNTVESHKGVEPGGLSLKTEINVITAGRLVSWKRVDGIIAAIAQLDGIGLVVVGDGPERSSLEELALELGVRDRIFFAGLQDKLGLQRLMRACDIFVLNSTYEGLPFVLLEAMSVGLPVIATAVGGVPEIVENKENGLLLAASDEQIVLPLAKLMQSDGLRRRLGKNASELILRQFNSQRILDQTEELLLKTAGQIAEG